jgi:hypothetical protein
LRGEIVVNEKITGQLLEKFSGRKTMDSPLEGLTDRELLSPKTKLISYARRAGARRKA